jgi:hypothetical protein
MLFYIDRLPTIALPDSFRWGAFDDGCSTTFSLLSEYAFAASISSNVSGILNYYPACLTVRGERLRKSYGIYNKVITREEIYKKDLIKGMKFPDF